MKDINSLSNTNRIANITLYLFQSIEEKNFMGLIGWK